MATATKKTAKNTKKVAAKKATRTITEPVAAVEPVAEVKVKPLGKTETINLQTQTGRDRLVDLASDYDDPYEAFDFRGYLAKPQPSRLKYGKSQVYVTNDPSTIFLDGRIVRNNYGYPDENFGGLKLMERYEPTAVVVTDCTARHGRTGNLKSLLLLNADKAENDDGLVGEFGPDGHPSVSFECLGQMYGGAAEAVKYLASGRLRLLDYTVEETIAFTAKEKILAGDAKKAKQLKSPRLGFSRVGHRWHRASSVLLHDTKTNKFFVFGQDEGSYFGCELPKAAKTVQGAFDTLVPDAVREVPFVRQGEWFFVPVDDKDVPATKDCALQFETGNGYPVEDAVFMPLETADSNRHHVCVAEGRVGPGGVVYVRDGTADHDEHESVVLTGWYAVYRNTAVRSVSQEGVD